MTCINPFPMYTLRSQWQCQGGRGYTSRQHQVVCPARVIAGGDRRDPYRPCICHCATTLQGEDTTTAERSSQ
jgi:hypothetical protein